MPVVNDIEILRGMGVAVVERKWLLDRKLIRHDPDATAAIAVRLAHESRQRQNT